MGGYVSMMSQNQNMLTIELRRRFNYSDFKSDVQKSATEAVYKRDKDVFICMPSGAGKSICFLLPAILQDKKVALVICPSLSLIQNQITSLKRFKIRVRTLHPKMTSSEKRFLMKDLQAYSPRTKVLYLTPEMAIEPAFAFLTSELSKSDVLSYIVIDEAHCVSKLGHDYRPVYQRFEKCKTLYNNTPIIALTATAQQEVIEDVLETLQMENVAVFTLPVFRNNLFYDVWFIDTLSEPYIHLKHFITENLSLMTSTCRREDRNSGIIYCRTKQMTELVARKLLQLRIKNVVYHAGLNSTARIRAQREWTEGFVPVVVATSAFGIGINKGSVRFMLPTIHYDVLEIYKCPTEEGISHTDYRFVVHWTVPQSIGTYYQESGRAGRDQRPAYCRIYVSKFEMDAIKVSSLTRDYRDYTQVALNRKNCTTMFQYCLETRCRHAVISKYFGNPASNCNNQCDCCKNKSEVERMVEEFERSVTKQPVYLPYEVADGTMDYNE